MNAMDRELPNSIDAERALLGSVLQSPAVYADAARLLPRGEAELFFESHQILWRLVGELVNAGRSVDGVLIKDELIRRGQFEIIGGFDFLTKLLGSVPHAFRASEYAEIVHDHFLRRSAVRMAYRIDSAAFDPTSTGDAVVALARREVDAIADLIVTDSRTAVDELMDAVCEQAESGQPARMIETHLGSLNGAIGGLAPGEVCVIGARPSQGKSAMAINLADHAANSGGEPTLFLSLEMSGKSVATRILANHAGVNSHHIRLGRGISRDASERLQAARARLRKRALVIDDAGGVSIGQVVAACRADFTRRKTSVIVVDYLTLIRDDPGARFQREDQAIGDRMKRLKAVAKELQAAVVVLAQLKREVDREGREPTMADLRSSGDIEQDADVILFLHNPDPNGAILWTEKDGQALPIHTYRRQILVAKNRNGQSGHRLDVAWTPAFQRFADIQPGDGAAPQPIAHDDRPDAMLAYAN